MNTIENIRKLYEEEDDLLKRILADLKLQEIQKRAIGRINMLRRLAERHEDHERVTIEEIEKLEKEDNR